MTEPKFHLGQHVAVCAIAPARCQCGTQIFPKTIVTKIVYFDFPYCPCGIQYRARWHYAVDADVEAGFFAEDELRPIDPDKEYSDEEELTKEKVA